MDDSSNVKHHENPRSRANIFEILTFSWLLNVFKTGYKRDLNEKDLYLALSDHNASFIGSKLEKGWKDELVYAKNANREPSLLRTLLRIFGPMIMLYGSLQAFTEIGLRISRPLIIGGMLAYFNPVGLVTTEKHYAYYYATGLVLNMLVTTFLHHYVQMELEHCGMKIRVACCSAIYKKALKLSRTTLGKTTVGQVVNLISNDVGRFDVALKCVHFLWIGPLGTLVVTYLMWREIGVSSFFGVAALLMVTPIQAWMGTKTSEFRLMIAPRTDERVRLMNEIISGMQVIKMYTWERPFGRLIKLARKKEIQAIKKASYVRVILQSFRLIHTKLSFFISILVYVMLGNTVTTKKVFVLVLYYNIMSIMTVIFPQGIMMVADILVSIKRIQAFLLNGEIIKQITSHKANDKPTNGMQMSKINGDNHRDVRNLNDKPSGYGIIVKNASAKWIQNQPDNSLNNIYLSVRPGRLVAIIGPVGAGKSSLFQAILQELPLTRGIISVRGVVSYASQEPWLFNASVQQNILFGSPMDKERYKEVVQACALKTDFVQLPYGDKSMAGERGVTLSGGQKARINLARTLYKQADIYLLDDPLSAVDTVVGQHLFDKCIKGYLKDKCCILITHQIQYLTSADHIVFMENGNVLADGLYEELRTSDVDLTKMLESSVKRTAAAAAASNADAGNKNDCHSYLEVPLVSPLRDSRLSVSSSSSSADGNGKCRRAESPPGQVAETRSFGTVSRNVYFSYIAAGGGALKIFSLVFVCLYTQVLCTGGAYWISHWVYLEDHVFRNETLAAASNNSAGGATCDPAHTFLWWTATRKLCVIVYAVINSMVVVVVVARCVLFVSFFTGTSTSLHDHMFDAITNVTMYFFNTNSSGRILNRFTKDMGIIDETIQMPLMDFVNTLLSLIGTLVIVGVINIYLMIPTFFVGIFYYYAIVIYLSTSRSTKRLEGISRSSVYGHLNASLQGLSTIRAFEAEDILSKEFDNHQDLNSSAWYLFISSSHAFGFALDVICLIYISLLCYIFLFINDEVHSGYFGLVITQAMGLMNRLQWGIRQSADLENQMTAVERVLEYKTLTKEAGYESSLDKKPPLGWPSKGQIVFHQFCLQYSPDAAYVLKNINVKIDPLEKVGIVGRTGAGKSSLISAMFRLALNEGNIIIDDVEIHDLGLHDLRSKLSIIPQEPVMFSGTMRTNLDPFDEYPDHDLWNALDEVQLKDVVDDLPDGLNSKMSEGGSNFSVGQKQLVCLARAILRSNKILILDEATANVDSQTSALIQNTIRKKFQNCTVLTIAHRLNTVMDSDKVLVMDSGTIVESDHPYNLLKNKNGYLYKMVEQTGRATSDWLYSIAEESYKTRNTVTTRFPIFGN